MPLMKGKSEKAFSHNVSAEMHAGKPQKQSLAIAYSLKRKAAKKMAHGGEVDEVNEKLHPEHEPMEHEPMMSRKKSIAEILMDKHGYAKGGEVEDIEPLEHEEEGIDDAMEDDGDADEGMGLADSDDEVLNEDGEPGEDKKKIMGKIMAGIRMRHMGR